MLRLGRISYVNMAPVFYRLDHEVEEVSGVPTELNARLVGHGIRILANCGRAFTLAPTLARSPATTTVMRSGLM